jgi:hypothetical protein
MYPNNIVKKKIIFYKTYVSFVIVSSMDNYTIQLSESIFMSSNIRLELIVIEKRATLFSLKN